MTVLILGSQGNLGTQLTKVLTEDFSVIAWDKEELDVLNSALLREKIDELAPDIIVNAVAYNAVDNCESKKYQEISLKLNCNFPGVLADLALNLGAVLVHYSSDYVFSGTEEKKEFLENDVPNPVNKYGETKFQGEQEVLKRAKEGLKLYLIRTSKLFGPLGQSKASKPSFFDLILNLAQTGKELTVVNEELSCFTYTPDLARATKKLITMQKPFGIYHLVNSGAATWYEATQELFKLRKININIRAIRSENLVRLARRPKFSILRNTKFNKLRSWQEALKEYICEE